VLSSLPAREKATVHSNIGAPGIGHISGASALASEESRALACSSCASHSGSSIVIARLTPSPSIERPSLGGVARQSFGSPVSLFRLSSKGDIAGTINHDA
jgi:hypothetical protein